MTVLPFLDLSQRAAREGAALERALGRIARSGRYLEAEETAAFERELATWLGLPEVVACASGTAAIELLLRVFDIGPGDEVLVSALTCPPTFQGIHQSGARPVPVETDPLTRQLDPGALAAALTPRTKAVLVVQLHGQPSPEEPLRAFCREHDLDLLADAAQSLGAELDGSRDRPFYDGAATSFYPTKNLACLGDGGALLLREPERAARARRLRQYGGRGRVHPELGPNARIDELQAAVLRLRLPGYAAELRRRRELAATYLCELADLPGLELPLLPAGVDSAWHLFALATDRRDELQCALEAEGIGSAVHYPFAPHQLAAWGHLGARLPRTEALCGRLLSLPLHPDLAEADQARVIDAVRAFATPAASLSAPRPRRAPVRPLRVFVPAGGFRILPYLRDHPEVAELIVGLTRATAPGVAMADRTWLLPPLHHQEYPDALLEVHRRDPFDAMLPCLDSALAMLAGPGRPLFDQAPFQVLCHPPEVIDVALDKVATAALFDRAGLPAPRSWTFEEFVALPEPPLPVFLKPRFPQVKDRGQHLLEPVPDRIALDHWRAELPRRGGSWLLQELVEGTEFNLYLFCTDEGSLAHFSVGLRAGLMSNRTTATIQFVDPAPWAAHAAALAAALPLRGCAFLQGFVRDDGSLVYTEINARLPGTTPVLRQVGVDLIDNLLRLAQDRPLQFPPRIEPQRLDHRLSWHRFEPGPVRRLDG